MKVEIGNKLKLKNKGYTYEVFDIIGEKKNVPTETKIVFLKLLGKTSWFENAQFVISCPERSLDQLFEETIIR